MLYNLFENRDFVSVFAVALLAEGVDRNCATYGLTYRDVATGADVKRSTLIECTTGRCAGHELIPKVRQFMADYEAQKASS